MPNLKDLKLRIDSVKSTQKITSAMKMVAASKLRRAQEQAEAARPFAERMGRMLSSLAVNVQGGGEGPKLMTGTGSDQVQLLVVISSDRGLCGAFNGSIVRETRRQIQRLQAEGKTVKLLTVGRKARDQLRRDYASLIVESYEDVGRRKLSFADADRIAKKVLEMYDAGEYDVCSVVYNQFKSAISQVVTLQQIVPFAVPETAAAAEGAAAEAKPVYEFEPDEEQILAELLPRNLAIQIYRSLLESAASEQGARMTAMDNATRNAGDMINRLTITYNRTRQAYITKELIEIISGAEAI
ncbi:F-type H+-transporting ATPase subunit gamma [Azospirillum fermentarium]|uniref:F0F1 ATP synthase subunit gamma n=1 Tax=Azospirillum fermentarium TaxID=1233114 RepID=UPI0022278483|nr:F0F1 ATP synthase subunit gamma [Azospirillum fermentarium]MCW2244700.1 F-type H+-transporting ATPase subunit gamma [Azospirillum fermentarium]